MSCKETWESIIERIAKYHALYGKINALVFHIFKHVSESDKINVEWIASYINLVCIHGVATSNFTTDEIPVFDDEIYQLLLNRLERHGKKDGERFNVKDDSVEMKVKTKMIDDVRFILYGNARIIINDDGTVSFDTR